MTSWLTVAEGEQPAIPAVGMTWDDLDALNAQTYTENQQRSLGEVLTDFYQSHQLALCSVEALPDVAFTVGWTDGRTLGPLIAGNTYKHYQEHLDPLRAWLQAQSS